MDIEELEKRIALMCKLSAYNQKIREDYDRGISAVLDGTQRVIDFMTKNSKDEPLPIKDIAVGMLKETLPLEVKAITKGIEMINNTQFFEPKEPIHPVDTQIKIEMSDNSFLEEIFKKVSNLRLQINESEIDMNNKYMFEKSIYELQKMIWDKIKGS